MIQHLNPVRFQDFGTILPERRKGSPAPLHGEGWQILRLTTENSPVYCTESETLLSPGSGITILSVCLEKDGFQDFYLDKPVKLH